MLSKVLTIRQPEVAGQNPSVRSYYLVMRTISMPVATRRQGKPIGLWALTALAPEGEKPYRNLYQTALNLYMPVDAVFGSLLSKMQTVTPIKGRESAIPTLACDFSNLPEDPLDVKFIPDNSRQVKFVFLRYEHICKNRQKHIIANIIQQFRRVLAKQCE